jgi:phosphoribosylformylglycinamidine synthase
MRVKHNGEVVCDVPVKALTDEAPIYQRPMKPVSSLESRVSSSSSETISSETEQSTSDEFGAETNSKLETRNSKPSEALLKLLASPNLASKEWVYRQYDHMVRTNTAVLPGADAAVVRIKETRRALAISLDGNGRYCAANPREGARLMVAEAARNVVCVGAQPIAITNCLNFASPERPEVMWAFSEVIDGIAEACKAFDTPVISGNVSFYNETEGRGILPTPVIGMVGLIEDVRKVIQPGFKKAGDFVALLGATRDDLSISEYAKSEGGNPPVREGAEESAQVPQLNLDAELAVQTACLRGAAAGLLRSAHDCSDGGLAVALAECCFSSHNRPAVGAEIDVTGEFDIATRLFSETPSRIIISFAESALGNIEEIVAAAGCPMTVLGNVGSEVLRIESDGETVLELQVAEMETAWRSSLKDKLQAEAMAAGAE